MPAHAASSSDRSRPTAPLLIGLAALVLFLLLVPVAKAPSIDTFDLHAERWCAGHQSAAVRDFFDIVSKVAGISGLRILGFASAGLFFLLRSRWLGVGMAAVVLAGMQTFETAKHIIARPRPAHGFAVDPTFAFPSGHATLAVAVCGTLAYLLWRERLLPSAAALGAGIALPVIVGISRVYLDMHWATDVAGGWLAGLIIACAAVAAYELTLTGTPHGA